MLRAIAQVWDWRRRLDRGEVATIKDITGAFVSRFPRLAYLAPDVIEGLLIRRRPCSLSLNRLAATALVPWVEQLGSVHDE